MSDLHGQSPGQQLQDQRLQTELQESGRLGSRLEIASTPFKLSTDQVAGAIITGPRRYMLRQRRIELDVDRLLADSRQAWHSLARHHTGQPEQFDRAWRRWLAAIDLTTLTKLIEAHNRYYPIEANLPMDPRTSDYVAVDGRDYRWPIINPEWLLERFPADLAQALTASETDQARLAGDAPQP